MHHGRAPPVAAALDGVLGLLARQLCMKQEPSWTDLHQQLDDLFEHPAQIRSIMRRVEWCSHSALFTGVSSAVAQGLVDRIPHASPSQDQSFSEVFFAIFDPLVQPCRDDNGRGILKACRATPSTAPTTQRCAKRWNALVPSLRQLIETHPSEFAACVSHLNLVALASYRVHCVSVAFHHVLHLILHATSVAVIQSLVRLAVHSVLHVDAISIRDDLFHRLHVFLQDLPFQASAYAPDVLAAITASLLDHTQSSTEPPAASQEALVLLAQVTCAVFQDVALDLAGGWFAQLQESASPRALDRFSAPLGFLTGFCAHTSFVPEPAVAAFVATLVSHSSVEQSLFAALYIALHRNIPLSNWSLDLSKAPGLAQLPAALVAHVLTTYANLSANEVMNHMHRLGMKSTTDAVWMNKKVPFAATPVHLRTLELIRFHRIPPLPVLMKAWTAGAPPSTTPVNHHLHPDVLRHVFSFLTCKRLCRLASVCRAFRDTSLDPWLWQQLYTKLGANLCTHPSSFAHDWKVMYQQRYLVVRRLRRAGKTKTWCLCDHCGCDHINKTQLQAERHHGKVHQPRARRRRQRDQKLVEAKSG